ncbi:MAG: ArsR/SmtB family transcription factor [Steroidobacteraceae bacterium]|jgi:DNA-binding transcriptional ArsR family regulator
MRGSYLDRDAAEGAAELLKVYAQPQRLMILSCLLGGPRVVSDIEACTGIGQPALSQQLATLRRAGLVTCERESRQVRYALSTDQVCTCMAHLQDMFAPQLAGKAVRGVSRRV